MKTIGDNAFMGCSNLIDVAIPDNVINIGKSVFFNCSSLESVTINDSIIKFGFRELFLDSISQGNLKKVTISGSVSSIPKFAFRDCSSLISVTIPNSVISIERASFSGCSSLTSLAIGNSVVTIEERAFESCSSLMEVIIPKSASRIGNAAFKNCKRLERINMRGNAPQNYASTLFEGVSKNAKVFINPVATGFGETFAGLPVVVQERIEINTFSKSAFPFNLSFESELGSTYLIDASHDLKQWGKIGEAQGTGSSVEFTDRRKALFQKQYYRVKLVE
tara:strand:+ start:62 stop:895 length:834 start_codon:yes stop_codon:yes gene_type:complete